MSTLYSTVSTTDGPQGYTGRHRKRRFFTLERLAVSLLITFWLTAGTVGAIAAHGQWFA